jgi:HAD superfamily hydrolase (TIGR01509 family)
MLRAIIFDFNGIILNDEPLHFASMRDAVAHLGVTVSREEYWSKYLPFDDPTCLQAICRDRGVDLDRETLRLTLDRKASLYQKLLQNQYPLFPGVVDFIRKSALRYPLALASGARRDEIETTLVATRLIGYFSVIVGAEDFSRGKPNPESYLLALERLNSALDGKHSPIHPHECLVIEDSVGGVRGAQAAGMKCLAVSNTYPVESLRAANRIIASLEEADPVELECLMEEVD